MRQQIGKVNEIYLSFVNRDLVMELETLCGFQNKVTSHPWRKTVPCHPKQKVNAKENHMALSPINWFLSGSGRAVNLPHVSRE